MSLGDKLRQRRQEMEPHQATAGRENLCHSVRHREL